MRHPVLVYGLVGGLLIALLRFLEYRWLVLEHSVEIYGGVVAVVFAAVGVWLGARLVRPAPAPAVVVREVPVRVEVPVPVPTTGPFARDQARVDALGLTARELEVLEQIAAGLSNREVADRLCVSEHTVKTHASRAFDKLGARRRTQAVQMARDQRPIP